MRSSDPPVDLELVKLRRALHAGAELSDEEEATAAQVEEFLRRYQPDELLTGLGGHGLAAVFGGAAPGPTVMFRAELDALPIDEGRALDHAAIREGVSHKCGHDGHMSMLAGLAPLLQRERPLTGRVVLLFQPAEETGRGALRVLGDERFAALAPDWIFALHNLPGYPLGQLVLRRGVFAATSKGLVVELNGTSAHAAEPHLARSPALAMAQLIEALATLPQNAVALHSAAKVTTVYARLGDVAFGTTPGKATVMATLRAYHDSVMQELSRRCVHLIAGLGATWGVETEAFWTEAFPATDNADEAIDLLEEVAGALGIERVWMEHPAPFSEDFGHLTALHRGALFGLGAGEAHPALHHPDYDFPDELLGVGTRLMWALLQRLLGDGG